MIDHGVRLTAAVAGGGQPCVTTMLAGSDRTAEAVTFVGGRPAFARCPACGVTVPVGSRRRRLKEHGFCPPARAGAPAQVRREFNRAAAT